MLHNCGFARRILRHIALDRDGARACALAGNRCFLASVWLLLNMMATRSRAAPA